MLANTILNKRMKIDIITVNYIYNLVKQIIITYLLQEFPRCGTVTTKRYFSIVFVQRDLSIYRCIIYSHSFIKYTVLFCRTARYTRRWHSRKPSNVLQHSKEPWSRSWERPPLEYSARSYKECFSCTAQGWRGQFF